MKVAATTVTSTKPLQFIAAGESEIRSHIVPDDRCPASDNF
jgi:hypothetical protein